MFAGCAKQRQAPASASETVMKVFQALAKQDTAAYLNLVCESRREAYTKHPDRLRITFADWSGETASVRILSESQDSTIAIVTYRLKTVGNHPLDTNYTVQLYLENGAWKYGYAEVAPAI